MNPYKTLGVFALVLLFGALAVRLDAAPPKPGPSSSFGNFRLTLNKIDLATSAPMQLGGSNTTYFVLDSHQTLTDGPPPVPISDYLMDWKVKGKRWGNWWGTTHATEFDAFDPADGVTAQGGLYFGNDSTAVWAPATGGGGSEIDLQGDGNLSLTWATGKSILFYDGTSVKWTMDASAIAPFLNNTGKLGQPTFYLTDSYVHTSHMVHIGSSTGSTGGTGSVPTIASGSGIGGTPTVAVNSGSTDTAGTITLTGTSNGSASATAATITFHGTPAWGTAPRCFLSPVNASASALSGAGKLYIDQTSTTTSVFILKSGATVLPAGTYAFNYFCLL